MSTTGEPAVREQEATTVFFHRPLTLDDVVTARALAGRHLPVDDRPRAVCAAADHRIVVPVWPCRDARWAALVLEAHERGEIPDPSR